MPTAYTDAVANGASFEEFAMLCARAFGPCISMRDEPISKPIPFVIEPMPYYTEVLITTKQMLDSIKGLSAEEVDEYAKADAQAAHDKAVTRNAHIDGLRIVYGAMRERVEAWDVPSPQHVGLKQFMLSQIDDTVAHDCRNVPVPGVHPMDGEAWRAMRVDQLTAKLDKAQARYQQECEGAANSTMWLTALRRSLGLPLSENEDKSCD